MLTRQKTVLSLLTQAGRPLSPTVFMKLVFLLRQETDLERVRSFYDFVPYNFGPFSFTLYWDLGSLRQNGYVTPEEERVALCGRTRDLAEREAEELPSSIRTAVADILERYGRMNQRALIRDVYSRYPWYATKSELTDLRPEPPMRVKQASPAVYTAGYEGRSVDAFFNDLLKRGIHVVVDVRANPISRKYGFSGLRLGEFCKKLGLEYRHVPNLGIPSSERAGLNGFASYQRLLNRYEQAMLPGLLTEVKEVGSLMRRQPAVLVCVEKDVRCCHRSRLADAVATATGLEVVHL
ncbi:MAG: DUF488 family protein [Gemmatimonadota bacterium]